MSTLVFPGEALFKSTQTRTNKDNAFFCLKIKKPMYFREICISGGFKDHEKSLFSTSGRNVLRRKKLHNL